MWRDENFEPVALRGLEEPLDIFDGVVLCDAVANQLLGGALLTQEIILRVGDQHRCVVFVDVHVNPPLFFASGHCWLFQASISRRPSPGVCLQPSIEEIFSVSPPHPVYQRGAGLSARIFRLTW